MSSQQSATRFQKVLNDNICISTFHRKINDKIQSSETFCMDASNFFRKLLCDFLRAKRATTKALKAAKGAGGFTI